MPLGSLQGRARASPTNPIGAFECDRCRVWWPRTEARWQFYWRGAALANSGLLVCHRCEDVPNEQYRVLILPGDPQPFENPRPSPDITPPYYAGQFPPPTPGNFGFGSYQLGSIDDLTYPTTKAAVLTAIAAATGIPLPNTVVDKSIVFSAASTSQSLMGSNSSRTWLLAYSPVQPYAAISTTTAILGATGTSLPAGVGQGWFQSTGLGFGPIYQGALSAAGLTATMPFFAFESPGSVVDQNLINNGGALAFVDDTPYPKESGAPGAFYSNGGEVTVSPGYTGGTLQVTYPMSAFYLFTFVVDGNDLPLVGGAPGSGLLWNNGGVVCVS